MATAFLMLFVSAVRSSWNVCWHTALKCPCLFWTHPCQPTAPWKTCRLFIRLFMLPVTCSMLQNQKILLQMCQLLFLTALRMVRFFPMFFKFYFIILNIWVFSIHVCLYSLCLETRRTCWIPGNWCYRELWAAMWVLGIEPWSSGRANARECWVISPAPACILLLLEVSLWEQGLYYIALAVLELTL